MSPGCLIKNWAKYVLPLLRSALCGQRETVKPQRETQALSLSVAAIPLLMTYSFTSLHCLENNEGVCCINLCNGEQEEGWEWGGGGGYWRRRGGEEKSDELMLLHCSSYIHTLHLGVLFHVHPLTHALFQVLCANHRLFIYPHWNMREHADNRAHYCISTFFFLLFLQRNLHACMHAPQTSLSLISLRGERKDVSFTYITHVDVQLWTNWICSARVGINPTTLFMWQSRLIKPNVFWFMSEMSEVGWDRGIGVVPLGAFSCLILQWIAE